MTAPMITIGRFTGILNDIQRSGDTLRVAGQVRDGSTAETAAWMQQFSGLLGNRDEKVVPVVCPVKPDLDGFYRPVGGVIDELRGFTKKFGRWEWSIELERVSGGFGNPSFESTLFSVLRTNGNSVTATPSATILAHPASSTWEGVNGDYRDVVANVPSNDLTLDLVSADDGDLTVGVAATPVARSTYRWWSSPAEYYAGSCRVEVLVDGIWRPLVGRQVGRFDHWRISNGLVRLTPASDAGAVPGRFEFWVNGSTKWSGVDVAHAEYETVLAAFEDPTNPARAIGFALKPMVTVLRNSPELVVVQVELNQNIFTYAVARGRWIVTSTWTTPSLFTTQTYGFGFASTTACSDQGGGAIAANSATDGMFVVMGVAAADVQDLTEGLVAPVALASTGSIFIGAAPGSLGDLLDTFYAATSEQLQVVGA